ncbi:MAG: hypothetical protein AAF484_03625 [Pseudomonadota bacterium]
MRAAGAGLFIIPDFAQAHAAEGGFVLLLPTDIYIAAGVAVVALTPILLALLPSRAAHALFTPVRLWPGKPSRLRHLTRGLSAGLFVCLVWQGFSGTRDPLGNPLSLTVWTLWWVILVTLQGLVGDIWRWLNPWLGLFGLIGMRYRRVIRYPGSWGYWPAVLGFLAFAGFLLADIAPADPTRLAWATSIYAVVVLAGCLVFGQIWIARADPITVIMRTYGLIAPFARLRQRQAIGVWGWRSVKGATPAPSLAVLMVLLLGTGSFDGLNETFWWIGVIGLNPLEFTGRSAAQWQSLTGLLVANLALLGVFASGLWAGARLAGDPRHVTSLFCIYAPTLLPIALGYHIAHYLTAFLVDGQYFLKMLDDPLDHGLHWLGMQETRVTTGFFNHQDSVRVIWLTQAGAVVLGHVIAILMAHATALRSTDSHGRAVLGQLPIALFMVAYTFLGLWLLATPRGL